MLRSEARELLSHPNASAEASANFTAVFTMLKPPPPTFSLHRDIQSRYAASKNERIRSPNIAQVDHTDVTRVVTQDELHHPTGPFDPYPTQGTSCKPPNSLAMSLTCVRLPRHL